MSWMPLTVVCLILTVLTGTKSASWSYEDVESWPETFPDFCAGKKQSPVNIDRFEVTTASLHSIQFSHYNDVPELQSVTNNGHSLMVAFVDHPDTPTITLNSSSDVATYEFQQYHFHWGSVDFQGSEHTIDTVKFPMEVHLVHKNKLYETVAEAAKHSDGLAVLSVFFVISVADNPALTPLTEIMEKVQQSGSQVSVSTLYSLASLLPDDLTSFYRYMGGLTTPTCDEAVVWTVFEQPITVSQAQLEQFRSLVNDHGHQMVDNFRPTQPLNGREIYMNEAENTNGDEKL